ncbi:MAG: PIN domain-containing protein [Candidatus Woesearchaeota archaeon]|nr:PIN domain-containing protein [Candidatus Woesearchaeota archaeon]
MQEKIRVYCDTNIYLDFLLGRKDYLRPLDEFAHRIFRRIEQGEFLLVISDHLIFELRRYIEEDTMNELLNDLMKEGKTLKVFKTNDEIKQAKASSQENWKDILHAILAHKGGAKYLLTRNLKDYAGCEHLIQTMFPENI